MIWTTQFEEVSVSLGEGRSVSGNVSYLVNQDGVELRVTGQLGDDIDIAYKDQKFENGIIINIPAVRLVISENHLVEVLLYQAINQEYFLQRMPIDSVAGFVNVIINNLYDAIIKFPEFFRLDTKKYGTVVKVRFVLSSSKRWLELKDLVVCKDVV